MTEQYQINVLDAINEESDVYAAIFFTFGADLAFFEEAVLHDLWNKGCRHILVFIDAGQYENIIRDFAGSVSSAGIRYLPVPIDLSSSYVFHPKMVLLLKEQSGRLLIGSGNLGFAGYGRNLETYSCFDWTHDDPSHLPLFQSAWQLCQDVVQRWVKIEHVLQVLQHVPQVVHWLTEEAESEADYHLLHTLDGPLLPKIHNLLAREEIDQITVITPFLDDSARAVQSLFDLFRPKEVRLIIQNGRISGNIDALRRLQQRGYPLSVYTLEDAGQYLHAKVYLFKTKQQAHIVTGSANCTHAAMLSSPLNGNVELAVLRTGAKLDAFDYLFSSLKLVVQDASLDGVSSRPIPAERPTRRCRLVEIHDAKLVNGELSIDFSAEDEIDVSTLRVRLSTFPAVYLRPTIQQLDYTHRGQEQLTPEVLRHFDRPVALTFVGEGPTGAMVDIGCNELWINNRDQLKQESLRSRVRALRTGDQLGGSFLDSDSEWAEFAENLWAIIELDVKTVRSKAAATKSASKTGDRAKVSVVDDPETKILFFTSDDEKELHPNSKHGFDSLSPHDSDLFALLDRIQNMIPGAPKQRSESSIGITAVVDEERDKKEQQSRERASRRLRSLINRYVQSLKNGEYLALMPVHIILGHYVIFQRLIWLMSERGWADDNQSAVWITSINSAFFNPLGDLPPLADIAWSRHLQKGRMEEWEEYDVAAYAIASALRTCTTLPNVDSQDVKEAGYNSVGPLLASLSAILNISDLWNIHEHSHDELLPEPYDCDFGHAQKNLIAGSRKGILMQLDEWINQINLLHVGEIAGSQSEHYAWARITYLTAKHQFLTTAIDADQLLELCKELAFWTRSVGANDLSDCWHDEAISLLFLVGAKQDIAQGLFEYGKQLVQENHCSNAIRILDQTIDIAQEIGDSSLALRAEQFKWQAGQILKSNQKNENSLPPISRSRTAMNELAKHIVEVNGVRQ